MNVSCGIVGLPNAGKSTLFNAILKKQAALVANYPFATIKSNMGIVEVVDRRVDILQKLFNSANKKYSTLTVVDIAGLVKGAHKGEGLGNQFLAEIKNVNLILMLLRKFEDDSVVRAGSVSPKEDRGVLEMELALKDLQTLNDKANFGVLNNTIQKAIGVLGEGRLLLSEEWGEREREVLQEFKLLTMKPIIYVLNVGERELALGSSLNLEVEWEFVSAKLEFELSFLSKEDQREYLRQLGLDFNPLDNLIKKAYETLNLKTFFTANKNEARAWKFIEGSTALECAEKVHTDFANNFIAVEVVPFENLKKAGSWEQAKSKGWVKMEGKGYMVKDGDVMLFRLGRG